MWLGRETALVRMRCVRSGCARAYPGAGMTTASLPRDNEYVEPALDGPSANELKRSLYKAADTIVRADSQLIGVIWPGATRKIRSGTRGKLITL